MAKSDSFFIRAKVTVSGVTYAQREVDLGSFVNLGVSKSTLLRVHNVEAQYTDNGDKSSMIYYDGAVPGAILRWQLTTQTQSELVDASDKSFISGGAYEQASNGAGAGSVMPSAQTTDQNSQNLQNGYLVAVDSLFLGADSSATWDSGDVDICVVLECTLETSSQASSTALALSQQ